MRTHIYEIFQRLEQRKLYAFILLVVFLNKMTSLSCCPCLTAPGRLQWKRGLCSAFLLQDSLSCFLLHGRCSCLPEITSLKHLWEVDGMCSLSARQRSASHRLRVKQTGLPLCSRLRRWQSQNCCWVRDNSIWLISVQFSEDAWCPDSHSGRKPVLCVYVWCFFFAFVCFSPSPSNLTSVNLSVNIFSSYCWYILRVYVAFVTVSPAELNFSKVSLQSLAWAATHLACLVIATCSVLVTYRLWPSDTAARMFFISSSTAWNFQLNF